MYTSIVVGTDGSDRANVAVRSALDLAKLTGATVHGVHVLRPMLTAASAQLDAAALVITNADRQEEADRVRADFLAEAERAGVTAALDVFDGDPADALVKVAEVAEADLLVVGNRGMAGVKRFVLGSVPNKVSHRAPCSLLIVDTDRH
jgi:nucleotide-binding universal stress UspA family protein